MGQGASKSQVHEARGALTPSFCDALVQKLKDVRGGTNISVDPNLAEEDKVVLEALGANLKRYLDTMTEKGYKMNADMGDTGYFFVRADADTPKIWDQNRSPFRMITFVFYLDDACNAETVFNFCNTVVRPEKGKFMAFPSSWRYLHATRVKSGECRYIIGDIFIKQASPEA